MKSGCKEEVFEQHTSILMINEFEIVIFWDLPTSPRIWNMLVERAWGMDSSLDTFHKMFVDHHEMKPLHTRSLQWKTNIHVLTTS